MMSFREHLVVVFIACFVSGFLHANESISDPSGQGRKRLPNIVIIYADDLGQGDLSCYNSKCAYKTPRLDQMAREGIRFTDAHSPSTICSPSRYGLFSGQQIYRSTGRGGGAFEGPGGPSYLKPGTLTLGQMLQSKGYRTGVFGKWHVGLTWFDKDGKRLGGGFKNSKLIDYEKSTPLVDGPNQRGFDESFITPNCPTTDPLYVYIENGMVPVPASQQHERNNLPNPGGKWRWDNDEGWMSPGYDFVNADLIFLDKTKNFITKQVKENPDQPFLCVLSTQIAHAPVLPAEEFNGATSGGPRGDFVFELDTIVGRVLDLLTELNIDEETIVMFNSDNGAETVHVNWMRSDHNHDPAAGRRGMKRDGWEGGHRVPFIVRWPNRIPAGQVSNQLTNTTDIMATLASVIGYQLKESDAVDSFDMLPVMLGNQDESESVRPHMLTQSFRGEFQIRQGDWKYLDHKGSGGNGYEKGAMRQWKLPEKAPNAPGQLYDLAVDPGEKDNLYNSNEPKRLELQKLLENLKSSGRSAPLVRTPIGIDKIPLLKEVASLRISEDVSNVMDDFAERSEYQTTDWPAFRGLGGRGVAEGHSLPETWNADPTAGAIENVLWETRVPGLGHSSPVIVGDQLFLLTAVAKSGQAPLKVASGGKPTSADDNGEQDWLLLCYDKTNGNELWRESLKKGEPQATRHAKATHANTSVCIAGDKVISFLGSEGLYCHTLSGELVWKQDLGVINISKYGIGWGFSSSPVVHQDRILLTCDDPENPYITARSLTDGEEIWRTERSGICERSWGTPLVYDTDHSCQVVVNGWPWIMSYDVKNGKEVWRLKGGGDNPVPTPFEAHGLIYITNAHGGPAPVYAIHPTAAGDITSAINDSNAIKWKVNKGGSYMSTPVVYHEQIYLGGSKGTVSSLDAMTGERYFQKRLGARAGVIASLVAGDGKVYCASENGTVYVLKHGEDGEIIARNKMGAPCLASPAISKGTLFFRTTEKLIAIRSTK